MKSKKVRLLEKLLKWMSITILNRYKPSIVGITGSVGKTSTKEAVYYVLSKKYSVRQNIKNYNNEIGIPLTILGCESGGSSILKWGLIVLKWLHLLIKRSKYPDILVLEMGVDRPGDMDYLLSFVKPFVGVVTNVSSSHIEFFGSLERIAKEKGKLLENLSAEGYALINSDDELVSKMHARTKANIITYGFTPETQINVERIVYGYDDNQKPNGISFKLSYEGKNIPVRLRNILAPHQVYAALAAIGVGIVFKVNLVDATSALEEMKPPQSRMNLLDGIKGSFVIDDSYNSSPTSALAALDVLNSLASKRKIAVLGDMLELGEEEKDAHRKIGRKIFEIDADLFYAVGARMRDAVSEAVKLGYAEERILTFKNPMDAAVHLANLLQEGDLVLVKGSQGARMEKVVSEIMSDPEKADELVCRHTDDWKNKPFVSP